jgi:hypothetical protein
MRTVDATRYLTPLREGGSLPAIVEADDDGLYVLKFRGAGQGPKALIAELLAGEMARALGLPVPEIVFMRLDPELARTEPDPEIQDLIRASGGLNLALDYLPGALAYDPLTMPVEPELASRIVWFDALVGNVDRTVRNTNMLWWHGRLWLIDHGAALIFQHQWDGFLQRSRNAFAPIAEHVLLQRASELAAADAVLQTLLTPQRLAEIVALIPDAWLELEPIFVDRAAQRAAYLQHFIERLQPPRAFATQAEQAHAGL